ncbi:MAG: hypothetical protein HC800_15495 [Phormidesmis sp. RL_2_1]|nr:hypothetical protein [Phormidesmis sp. RL_2_1]
MSDEPVSNELIFNDLPSDERHSDALRANESGGYNHALWREIVELEPLTASSQMCLAKVMALIAARREASCILAVHRRQLVGIATRQDLIAVIAQSGDQHGDWQKCAFFKW